MSFPEGYSQVLLPKKVEGLLQPYNFGAAYHLRRAHIDLNREWDLVARFRTRTEVTPDMGSFEPSKDAVVLDAWSDSPRLAFISQEENHAYHRIELFDFDGDGVQELVQHCYIAGAVFRLENDKFSAAVGVNMAQLTPERLENFRRPRWQFCDLDADGVPELIIGGAGDSLVLKYKDGQFRSVE